MRVARSSSLLPPVQRGPAITVTVNGQPVDAFAGETVAAVLLAAGQRIFRRTRQANAPRGLFCGMGICFECLVTVNGTPNTRACVTPVVNGMAIETRSEVRL